jgi:hypothetical protein
MALIPTYQIWRKPISEYGEDSDVYVCFRRSGEEAQKWIDSQKDQQIPPDQYYIKKIGGC